MFAYFVISYYPCLRFLNNILYILFGTYSWVCIKLLYQNTQNVNSTFVLSEKASYDIRSL